MGNEGPVGRPRAGSWGYCVATLAIVLVSIGCSSSDVVTQAPTGGNACQGNVSISVGQGTEPAFTWRPTCDAYALLVEETGGMDVWLIEASALGISPGVRYGVVPAGSIEQERAMPLRAGAGYVVVLFSGPKLDQSARLGQASFTP